MEKCDEVIYRRTFSECTVEEVTRLLSMGRKSCHCIDVNAEYDDDGFPTDKFEVRITGNLYVTPGLVEEEVLHREFRNYHL